MKRLRGWLVRSREASLSRYGKYPGARSVTELLQNGLIVLDKPAGPTSHQVDNWIKKLTGVRKCSHGGTLELNRLSCCYAKEIPA